MKSLALLALIFLSACSSEGYIHNVAEHVQEVTIIEGSIVKRGFLHDKQRTYIKTINGLKPGSAWHDEPAKGPFRLIPGVHKIEIEHRQSFMAATYMFELTLDAGGSYVAMSIAEDKGKTATIWIQEKSSGKVISKKVEVRRQHNGGSMIIII